ncbi:MAG: undecaprenyl/decaprenyl-phosphate alpha-N-acetylglucosaminyl 1-phosphate transferase [Verrucomicrobiae bacterium]|nr:undecaprenyl/decaprenyl-phosphate alpha-N-acetylglucosaminyl 1-phosphate transferase [Verrucomicrobiae bacterium]MCX7914822.1 undecaprenyl/decaprenyl-phosphate alpha-N-acetylglucosaminyl 1-phosphate transferase [Verrucomicrobiae bacterium]MDW8342935.1 MraY family glycosyltransferase [Verrucomicrobiae bacterium]
MHWILIYFYIFDLSFALALLLTPVVRQYALRRGIVDAPNLDRKIHREPMPLLGGVAVFAAFALNVVLNYLVVLPLTARWDVPWVEFPDLRAYIEGAFRVGPKLLVLVAGGALMTALGLYDDMRDLKPGWKFLGQVAVAALVAAFGMRVTLFIANPVVSFLLTVLWIVTLTNALNFLDNMDGLCAGVGLVCALLFAMMAGLQEQYFVCLLALALAGALLGFLPYNFKPATIFLGDAGSHFVGYMLAVLPVLGTFYTPESPTWLPVLIPLLVLAVPLFDMAMVMAIRLRRGQPVYRGDANHISHRLVQLGLPQSWAVTLIYLITLTLGLGAAILLRADVIVAVIVLTQAICILAIVTLLEQLGRK